MRPSRVATVGTGSLLLLVGCAAPDGSPADDPELELPRLAALGTTAAPPDHGTPFTLGVSTLELTSKNNPVEIQKKGSSKGVVVYAVDTPGLNTDHEDVEVRGEVVPSRCNADEYTKDDNSDCRSHPKYDYDPTVEVALALDGKIFGGWSKPFKCTEARHHCARPIKATIPKGMSGNQVQLLLRAKGPKNEVRPNQVVDVEKVDGNVNGNAFFGPSAHDAGPGALQVFRRISGVKAGTDVFGKKPASAKTTLVIADDGVKPVDKRHVVRSAEIGPVRAGDVLDIQAKVTFVRTSKTVDKNGAPVQPLAGALVFLTDDPAAVNAPGYLVVRSKNGTNCSKHEKRCGRNKVGTIVVPPEFDNKTAYVNLVASATRNSGCSNVSDPDCPKIDLDLGSKKTFLRVRPYPKP